MSLFAPETRSQLREELVAAAEADPQIIGAAITGSAAVGREDRWSDIDLALCLAPNADASEVIARWTERMYGDHKALEHLDVWRGPTLFRVFLLRDTLQVDIAFWPSAEFGAIGPTFRLLFGKANSRTPNPLPAATHLIGMAWLYALHVRSSIARGRVWQAEFMLNKMREQVLALMCLRHGVSPYEGRGIDDLPATVMAPLAETLIGSLNPAELGRAFVAMMGVLLREVEYVDTDLANRLTPALQQMLLVDGSN